MAEIEQQHRMDSERAVINANIDAQKNEATAIKRGHLLGAGISALSLLSALWSVYLGAHWSVSVALVGVPIMSAVRAIILRK
jgi:uncharacterized membrane protein